MQLPLLYDSIIFLPLPPTPPPKKKKKETNAINNPFAFSLLPVLGNC